MVIAMILISLFLALIGAAYLSNATMGVGLICAACLFAIYARLAQAQYPPSQKKGE